MHEQKTIHEIQFFLNHGNNSSCMSLWCSNSLQISLFVKEKHPVSLGGLNIYVLQIIAELVEDRIYDFLFHWHFGVSMLVCAKFYVMFLIFILGHRLFVLIRCLFCTALLFVFLISRSKNFKQNKSTVALLLATSNLCAKSFNISCKVRTFFNSFSRLREPTGVAEQNIRQCLVFYQKATKKASNCLLAGG
jgi:hypothetical protein